MAADGVEKTLRIVITSGLVKQRAFLDALEERLEPPLKKVWCARPGWVGLDGSVFGSRAPSLWMRWRGVAGAAACCKLASCYWLISSHAKPPTAPVHTLQAGGLLTACSRLAPTSPTWPQPLLLHTFYCTLQAGELAALDAFKRQFEGAPFRKGFEVTFTTAGNKLTTQLDGKQVGGCVVGWLVGGWVGRSGRRCFG